MNEGYRYHQENYTTQDPKLVAASRAEIVSALGRSSLSVLELVALSNHPYDVTNHALHQLETEGRIRKTYELTDQQNAIIGYELIA